MRPVLALLAALPAFALSNAVTIQEKGGSTQTNRVLTIPRFFADKELCLYPRPYTGGSPVTYWQANVKNRWPADAACAGGYVKWGLITVELTLNGNSSTVVEFRSDASSSSGGSGLTKTQMLAFDAGGGAASWGAKITAAAGALSASVSARAMISNDHYQVIESGPLRTSVLVREGPDAVSAATARTTSFGFRCTANCTAPYDTATWTNDPAYYSMRPSFVVTFYTPHTGTGNVEVDYLVDNAWMDRAQDQRLSSLTLYKGGAETTACYTAAAAFVLPFRGRLFETCWASPPAAVNLDLNRAYVTYSKVTPAYGLEYTVGSSAITLEANDFNATDQGATVTAGSSPHMGWGQISDRNGATGGASSILGWVPRWSARYLATYSASLLPVVLGNAKAIMHAPMRVLEPSTSAIYRSGGSAKAFGKDVSLDVHPTYSSSAWTLYSQTADKVTAPSGTILSISCAAPTCMVTCRSGFNTFTQCSVFSNNTVNLWGWDMAHSTNEAWTAYFATGKLVYWEQMVSHANLLLTYNQPNSGSAPAAYGRWDAKGLVYDQANSIRGAAWPLRHLAWIALFAPDGGDEQAYFQAKLNNNLESHEGRFNITAGHFPPANASCSGFDASTETSIWRMSRCLFEGGGSNPLAFQLNHGGTSSSNVCYGCDSSLAADGNPPWMHQYFVLVLAWMRDLGLKAGYTHEVVARHTMHLFADSAFTGGNPARGQMYYGPSTTAPNGAGYFQTWASFRSAIIRSTRLAAGVTSGATSLSVPTICDTAPANLDLGFQNGTYWRIGAETIKLSSTSWDSKTISSVNTSTDRVTTSSAHGRTNGQIVRVAGAPIDSGMVGNLLCQSIGGTRGNYCDFWVKAIDTTTLEFYNDAALTGKVNLTGGGSGMYISNCVCAIARGQLGTTAAAHVQGETLQDYPAIGWPSLSVDPTGNHLFMYRSGLATSVDHDQTIIDEGTGATITARRVFELFNQLMYNQENSGKGAASCSNINSCDNPQWGISPRPLVRNARVTPGAGSVKLYYTAPDASPCRIGLGTSPFASTNDAADTADQQTTPARTFIINGLSPATTHHYRITCGPLGGAARVSGTFQTK